MAITALKEKPWYVGLGAGVALAAVIFAVMWWKVYDPKRQEITAQDAKLAELQVKIQEGRAAKQGLQKFREEVNQLELDLEKLRRIMPTRLDTEGLLRNLRARAEERGLDIIRVTPGNLTDRDFYSEWPITIQLQGTYHNLALFFDSVGRFSRIINVDNLGVRAIDPLRNQGDSINSSFVAKTFVYREEEPPAETPAEGQPAGSPAG